MMNIFARSKARFKIGQRYVGTKHNLIAQGFVVFKQWDKEDGRNYYWEEWELTGFDDYDSWVEYDHYSRDLTLYRPVRAPEEYDVQNLRIGASLPITIDGETANFVVSEVGTGTVAQLKGKMSYQLFKDDVIHYAEAKRSTNQIISIEDYRQVVDRDYDYYLGHRLDKKQQKKIFGKVITPFNWAPILAVLLMIGPFAYSFMPRYETVCTPRSTVSSPVSATTSSFDYSSTQQPDSSNSAAVSKDCKRVRVYGSSGVGK